MAASIPEPGSSRRYGDAAHDVRHSVGLTGRVADAGGIEGHDTGSG
jgi:hypothetical protein